MNRFRLIADVILTIGLQMLIVSWVLSMERLSHMSDLAPGVEFAGVSCLVGGAVMAFVLALVEVSREGRE